MTKQLNVAITVNKSGQKVAYFQSPINPLAWRRMGLSKAEMGVAAGEYQRVEYVSLSTLRNRGS